MDQRSMPQGPAPWRLATSSPRAGSSRIVPVLRASRRIIELVAAVAAGKLAAMSLESAHLVGPEDLPILTYVLVFVAVIGLLIYRDASARASALEAPEAGAPRVLADRSETSIAVGGGTDVREGPADDSGCTVKGPASEQHA